MAQIKLWSYGDSHAAGHELGSASDLGKSWLQDNFQESNRQKIIQKIGVEKFNDKVKNSWYNYIKDKTSQITSGSPCSPELSYAAELAKLLDYEFIDCAIPGSGNDYSVLRFLRDLPNINKNDLVLFSVVTANRFLIGDEYYSRTQIHWLPKKIQKVFFKYGPGDKSFSMWSQGLIHLVKNSHPNTLFLKTVDHKDLAVEEVDTTDSFFSLQDFTGYSIEKYGHDIRYVGGHISEHCHKDYARYVYEWMVQNYKG